MADPSGWLPDLLGPVDFQVDGVDASVPRRGTINLIGIGVSDDPVNERTNVSLGATLGTGVASFLENPSGANLAAALTSALPASKGGLGLTSPGASGNIPVSDGSGSWVSAAPSFTNPSLVFSNTALIPDTTTSNHAVFQSTATDHATRIYVEPNGHPSGTKAKIDWMFDPYEFDSANYRIMGMVTTDDLGTTGVNGVAQINVKGVGDQFGVFPALHIGFQDGSSTGVPLKLYNFDTSDTAWRTPQKGAWRTGVAYTSGDYVLANNKLYQSSTTATSGATKPSHSTGTVSDGAVSWLFVRDFTGGANIHPLVMIGDRDDMPKFGFASHRLQMSAPALFWNSKQLSFLDSTNATEAWKLYTKTSTSDFYIADATEAKFARFGGSSLQFQTSGLARGMGSKTEATLSATPDVSGCDILTFNNASGTVVTSFAGGIANQRLFVRSSNGQTTLQNGANLVLSGGADKTLSSSQVLEFVFGSSGTVATEVGGPAPGKSSGSAVSISTGTTTLSVAQASYPYIKLTGSLSGNVIVVFPAADGREWVVDATGCTLNAHTITLQANSNSWGTTIGITSLYRVIYNATLGKLVGSTLSA